MGRIALDAMGGDFAPLAIVEGALTATEKTDDELVLVGDSSFLNHMIIPGAAERSIQIVDCPDYIRMDEPGSRVIHRKKEVSVARAMKLLKSGDVEAVVTAGNSAGAVAAAVHYLGCFPGIDRPALACVLPTRSDPLLVVDVGANVEPQPHHLGQAALLGEMYVQEVFGVPSPRVGLLNIGTEKNKGTRFLRKTFKLVKRVVRNFIGNVEGGDLFNGKVHVVVCDGFVGNVLLKSCEAWGESVWRMWQEKLEQVLRGFREKEIVMKALEEAYRLVDYRQAGGAPLLGVDGTVVIAHGRSSGKAIYNAIKFADDLVGRRIIGRMKERFEEESIPQKLEKILPGAVFRKLRMRIKTGVEIRKNKPGK